MTTRLSPSIPPGGRRWQRLKEIVGEALERPEPERDAYLDEVCGDDEGMRREAMSLIELEAPSADFLEESAMPRVEAAPLAEGTQLGAYRVLGPLGSGGMGEVYLGERADGAFEQQVAIKVIGTGGLPGPELRERFLAERQLLAEMKHPNIAHLVDGGTVDDGRPYLVMEHVEGKPIDQYCKRRNLSVEARLRL
ncbi:MAG: protein kinase, partial [bacterium]|nr:protein kinase [bacterium]